MDSNNEPIERRKSGSLTFCSRILVGNIFPISQGQLSQNQVLGIKYIAGKPFTILDLFENVLKSDLWSPFQPYVLNDKEFLEAA